MAATEKQPARRQGGGPVVRTAALGLLGALLACGGTARVCRVAADCASGVCQSDGRCAPLVPDAAAPSDAGPVDAGLDAGGLPGDAGPDGGGPLTCQPNADGLVGRDEVPLAAGLHATFRIAQNASFDTAGSPLPDGGKLWDLSVAFAGEQNSRVDTTPLAGAWFEADFAGATYSSRLSAAQELLGVFEVTSSALLLRGIVSPTGGAARTELTYAPPVTVLAFPLAPAATWSTSTTLSGVQGGFAVTYFESYTSEVDSSGLLLSPFASFPVLRVRTELVRTGAFSARTFVFVTDCFGSVAAITSQLDEAQQEFTQAAELRRLAP